MTGLIQEQLAHAIAKVAHDGQSRKGSGEPYVRHPERVADLVAGRGWAARTVALLHDVVEDTKVTLESLGQLFPPYIVRDVRALTRLEDESYGQYVAQLLHGSETALIVKLADLADNLADTGWAGAPRSRYLQTRAQIVAELERRGVAIPDFATT